MKGAKLVVLATITVVLVVWAWLVTARRDRPAASQEEIGKPVLPALQNVDVLNAIETITFRTRSSTVVVARAHDRWVAPERYRYPVDYNKLHDFVRKLRNLTVAQCLPGDRASLEAFHLISPSELMGTNRSSGTLVELTDRDGNILTSVLIGKERRKTTPDSPYWSDGYPDGRFVSVSGKAYRVTETLSDMPSTVKDWLDADLVHVGSWDVEEIDVRDETGRRLRFKRPAHGGDLKVDDLTDQEEMDISKVNSLAGTLSYLRFNDVADPAWTDEQMGFDTPTILTVRDKARKTYTLQIGSKPAPGDDRYIRLSVTLEPEPSAPSPAPVTNRVDASATNTASGSKDIAAPRTSAAPSDAEKTREANDTTKETDEQKKKREEEEKKKKDEREKAEKEVRELNEKLRGWTYIVAKYKVDSVNAERKNFVKAKEKKEEEKKSEKGEQSSTKKDAETTSQKE